MPLLLNNNHMSRIITTTHRVDIVKFCSSDQSDYVFCQKMVVSKRWDQMETAKAFARTGASNEGMSGGKWVQTKLGFHKCIQLPPPCTEFVLPFYRAPLAKATLLQFYPLMVVVHPRNIPILIQTAKGNLGAFFFNRLCYMGHNRESVCGRRLGTAVIQKVS